MSYKALESTVKTTVEAMLPRFSHKNLALLLSFRVNVDYVGYLYKNRPQPAIKWKIRFLFNRPNNGTNVFVKVFNEHDINMDKHLEFPIEMELTSTHDSCWSSDGLNCIWDVQRKSCEHFEQVTNDSKVYPIRDINFNWQYEVIDGIKFVKFQPNISITHSNRKYTFDRFEQVNSSSNPELFEREV